MTFLVVHNTITVEYQINISTTFSNTSLNRPHRCILNAARDCVERIFKRGFLSYRGSGGKTCLETQNRQVHLHLPEEGDVNVLTKNILP